MKLNIETAPLAEAKSARAPRWLAEYKELSNAAARDKTTAKFVTLTSNKEAQYFAAKLKVFLNGTGLVCKRHKLKVYCYYDNGKPTTGSTPSVPSSQ